MSHIDESNIRRLDGTLLLVFRELLRQKRGVVAADRLGLSQSGVSHALNRLREVFGDPLFLRRPYGLEPTRRALELAPRIDALIALAQEAVSGAAKYDPASSTREFHIGSVEFMIPLLGAPLLSTLEATAPNILLVFRHLIGSEAVAALERGEIDVMIGWMAGEREGIVREPLVALQYVVLGRKGHPAFDVGLDLATYARLGHVLVVGFGRSHNISQFTRSPLGIQRRVVAVVPRFLTGCAMVCDSDAVLVAPRALAAKYADGFGLQMAPLPIELQPSHIFMARKASRPEDPGIEWLLEQIRRPVASLGGS